MSDPSVKIPVEIIPPKDSLKPIIKDVENLTYALKEQQKVLTGSTGLASTLNPTSSSPKAIFSQKESDRIADQKHAEEEAAKAKKAKDYAKILAPDSSEDSSSGSNLRSALRQGAQIAGLQRVGRALASLSGPLGIVVAGFAAVAIGVKVAWESIKAFVAERAKVQELNEALAVSGNLSNALSESVKDLARARAINSGISEDHWLKSYEELLRSGASANQLGALSDKLSELQAITGSMDEATKLLTGALKGEFSGFKELGIFIPEHATQIERINALYRQLASASGILESSISDSAKSFNSFKDSVQHAGIGVGGFVLQLLSGPIDRWTAALKEVSKFTNQYTIPDIEKDQKARRRLIPIIYDHAKATKELNEQLKDEKTLRSGIEELTNRMIAADKRAADAKKTSIELEKDATLAMIDSAEAQGNISHVTAALDRLQVNRQAEISKVKIDQAQKDKEISDRQKELATKGGGVRQAQFNLERAQFLFGDEKDPQKKAELEGNVEEARKRLVEAQGDAPRIRELREQIRILKEEKSQGFKNAAGKVAGEDISARTDIFQKHQEEVQALKKDPNARLTPIRKDQMGILAEAQKFMTAAQQYNLDTLKAMQLFTSFSKSNSDEIRKQASIIAKLPRAN